MGELLRSVVRSATQYINWKLFKVGLISKHLPLLYCSLFRAKKEMNKIKCRALLYSRFFANSDLKAGPICRELQRSVLQLSFFSFESEYCFFFLITIQYYDVWLDARQGLSASVDVVNDSPGL